MYAILATQAVTDNYKETARQLGVAESTVRKIVAEHRDSPEFAELCAEKREEFAQKAGRIIDKALDRLEKTIDDPGANIPINHLTTAIGTLYDKRALADGKPTETVSIVGNADIDKLAELAGYGKKQ